MYCFETENQYRLYSQSSFCHKNDFSNWTNKFILKEPVQKKMLTIENVLYITSGVNLACH